MDMPKEFYDMVCADIKRLDNVRNLSAGELFELHRQIDARYQACINKWCDGLWCSTNDGTHIAYGHLAQNPQKYVLSNLKMMKAKLETYKYQMNAVQLPKPEVSNSQVVNVTNSVNVNVTFEQVRKEVEEKMKSTMDIPIIGVSAKTDIDSKVNLIRNGADDYITKPFDNQELLVRIEAVLRRFQKSTTPNNSKILRFKDLSLDTEAMEAKIRNTPITLTRYEYLILQLLMSSPSKVFTKNNIFESVWNENFIGDDNAINVHIGNLRKKFAKVNPEEKYIQTVWGLGFKMQG